MINFTVKDFNLVVIIKISEDSDLDFDVVVRRDLLHLGAHDGAVILLLNDALDGNLRFQVGHDLQNASLSPLHVVCSALDGDLVRVGADAREGDCHAAVFISNHAQHIPAPYQKVPVMFGVHGDLRLYNVLQAGVSSLKPRNDSDIYSRNKKAM